MRAPEVFCVVFDYGEKQDVFVVTASDSLEAIRVCDEVFSHRQQEYEAYAFHPDGISFYLGTPPMPIYNNKGLQG